MTHGDPLVGGRSGRQTPVTSTGTGQIDPANNSGGEDSTANNTPISAKLGKMMAVRVLMLDDSITIFQVQVRRCKQKENKILQE
jgi:hypothetical protein